MFGGPNLVTKQTADHLSWSEILGSVSNFFLIFLVIVILGSDSN